MKWMVLCVVVAGCSGQRPVGEGQQPGGGGMMMENPENPENPMPQAPSFSKVVMPLIVERCTGYCHPGGYAPMALTADDLYYNLVEAPSVGCDDGRLRVAPGKPDPKDSYLMAKLTGTAMCGNSSPMPPRGARWPESSLSVVREWIAAGAKND